MDKLNRFAASISPAVKLTAAYVAIIMLISILFSVSIYNISASQLSETLNHEYARYDRFVDRGGFIMPPGVGPSPSLSIIQRDLEAGETQLQVRLVYFNIVILLFGSAVSYWLAKRTLRPIEEALEAQSRFTGDASHELRTPLAAMQTEIEVALRNPGLLKEDAKALLKSNLEEVGKLKALAEGLLRLARQDGDNGIALTEVSLEGIAVAGLNRMIPVAQAKKIAIENSVGDILVQGDADSLTELMVILLDNAIKYSEAKTTIRLSAKRAGRYASLVVTDEGRGIKATDLPNIFNRFYRTDSSRSKETTNGYGLGLSIARKIVALNHGSIDVRSTVGKGTTFTIKLSVANI